MSTAVNSEQEMCAVAVRHLSEEVGSPESTGCYSSFSFLACCSNIQFEQRMCLVKPTGKINESINESIN